MRDSFDAPLLGRTKVTEDVNELKIVVPARKRLFYMAFTTAWLGGWAFGLVAALGALFTGGGGGFAFGFLLFWLCGWTLGGLAIITTLIWMLVGFERITIDPEGLRIERRIGPIARKRLCALSHIQDMRVVEQASSGFGRQGPQSWHTGFSQGAVQFDYGRGTLAFGLDVDAGEGKDILAQITRRFPQLAG